MPVPSEAIDKVALPADREGEPREFCPSLKETDPVGTPLPFPTGVITAVICTDCPKLLGFGELDKLTLVSLLETFWLIAEDDELLNDESPA